MNGDDIKKAMVAADIKYVEHHKCSICEEMVFYSRDGNVLLFNSSCGCSFSAPKIVSWQSVADWINMQTSDEWRTKIMAKFGLNSGAVLR